MRERARRGLVRHGPRSSARLMPRRRQKRNGAANAEVICSPPWNPACALRDLSLALARLRRRPPPACRRASSICAMSRPASPRTCAMPASNNFTGRPLPGYDAPNACCGARWRRRSAACEADLAQQQLGLKVYDCYRPTRAVAAFARWAQERRRRRDQALLPHAGEAPPVLARLHRGALGAFDRQRGRSHACRVAGAARAGLRPARALTAPAPRRPPSARPTIRSTWAPASTASTTGATPPAPRFRPQQKRWRAMLVAAMRARGFHNYFREWWHFSFGPRAGAGL